MCCISTSSNLMFEQGCNQKMELLSWTKKDQINICNSYCQPWNAYRFKYRNGLFCGIPQCQCQETSQAGKQWVTDSKTTDTWYFVVVDVIQQIIYFWTKINKY